MSIIRVSKRERYVTIDKTPIEDPRLSFKATGLLAYLLSKRDNWTVNYRQLVKAKKDGRSAILAGLQELETTGYLKRQRRRTDDGHFTWEQVVYEVPKINTPRAENRVMDDHAPDAHAWSMEPLSEEGSSETPPTPPEGGWTAQAPKPKKTRPRHIAKQQEIIRLTNDIRNCGTEHCNGKTVLCTPCGRRVSKIEELQRELSA